MTTMTSPAPNTARHRWELAENKTMRLPRLRVPTVVRVERGTVLVTQEGDHEDHVLERGDELVVRRGGLAVAWAFTEATISMREVGRNGILALARKGRAGAAAGTSDLEQMGVRFAHELKNPLTGVKALVQLGLRNPGRDPLARAPRRGRAGGHAYAGDPPAIPLVHPPAAGDESHASSSSGRSSPTPCSCSPPGRRGTRPADLVR